MHGVEGVGVVVVASFVVADVDGDGRVESGEEVLGSCKDKQGEETELEKRNFKGATVKLHGFQSKAEHFPVKILALSHKRSGINK